MSEENLNEDKAGMAALETLSEATDAPAAAEPKIDAHGRSYATGRRKNASARVWIKRGSGRVTVNGKDITTYLHALSCKCCWLSHSKLLNVKVSLTLWQLSLAVVYQVKLVLCAMALAVH